MNIIKKNLKRAQFKAVRSGWISGIGDVVQESCTKQHIEDKTVDDAVFGDYAEVYIPEDFEKILQKGREKSLLQMDGGETTEANIIFDVFVLHDAPDPEAQPNVLPKGDIHDEQARSAIHSSHEFFRNIGANYHPESQDVGVNLGLGNIYHVNCSAIWGKEWDENGINLGGGGGISAPTIMEYCRKNISNTFGDGSRSAAFTFPRQSSTKNITGFTWRGVSSTSRLNGFFVKNSHFGDYNYKKETDPNFQLGDPNNKTTHHEIGHLIFGAFHTFQDIQYCFQEDTLGDRCDDTINVPQNDRCGIPLSDNPHNNIMSYSWRTWRKVFTPGQAERGGLVVIAQHPLAFNNPYYEWEANVIKGCTDPTANNYNPLATENDGSCDYRKKGCIDPNFVEYDPEAELMEWGACKTPHVDGCTDPTAINYNPKATRNDGSCTYDEVPVEIPGCTDPEALNYNPNATINDGSCEYPPVEIPGCMDPAANNFNPEATISDGSCTYDPPPTEGPEYKENRVNYIEAAHHFSLKPLVGFVGEYFKIENAEGIEIPIVQDECGNNNRACIVANADAGATYYLTSLTDQLTGVKHPQPRIPLKTHESKLCLDSTLDGKGIILDGIQWNDYFYSALEYQVDPDIASPANVKAHAVKRAGPNQSEFMIYTWSHHNNKLLWDNTSLMNRQIANTSFIQGEYNQISASRNLGLWLNGEKVLEPGPIVDVQNNHRLSVGDMDGVDNKLSGAYIFEITICKNSLDETKIRNFDYSTKVDYGIE